MRIAWLTYLDPFCFEGGGELHNRLLIETGRVRGHEISVSPWLRRRLQRGMRRLGMRRIEPIDWNADLFVLSNIHNCAHRRDRFPGHVLERALSSGRAVVLADAWLDVCPFDMPCGGDPERCRSGCDRSWAEHAYACAMAAIFVSPMQHRMIEGVLAVDLPPVIYSRPQIDVDAFRPLGLERDIDVLYVGTVKVEKGYHELIERFGAERVTLVGPDALGEPIAGTYLGPLAYSELPKIYNRARVFAHLPRWHEPMGRTVVEATLCGCEVITNDRVGVESYPDSDWKDPAVVSTNAGRFWRELESLVDARERQEPG